jgi:carbon storage regulator
MLVLTRRLGEKVVIDGDIEVMVVGVQGDKVRLGIIAPPCVQVDRQEVHQRRMEFDVPPVTRPNTGPACGCAKTPLKAASDLEDEADALLAWTTEWQS